MGCDPWLVFQNPYAPVFFDPGIIAAGEIGLPLSCNMFCMPAVANYLGGDITSGLLMTDIDVRSDPGIMLDIGTNGELVLGCRDFMLVGAGAAGPALEGYGSKYGMRAGKGAVRGCRIDCDGNIILDVIGGGSAEGICGTGIVDLIAQGYLSGWINGNGTLNYEASSRIIPVWNQERQLQVPAILFAETNGEKLYFTQDDIIEFIKCKAAAHTMVATMLDYCDMQPDEIGTLYLSGGFGTNLNLESAITIGLYPDLPRDKFEILGNSSLSGAKKLLLDDSCADRLRHITEMAVYVQFGEMEKFLENMIAAQFIPHTDERLYPSVKRRI